MLYSLIALLYAVSIVLLICFFFFFSSRRRHTRSLRDWSSDVCSSDLRADHQVDLGQPLLDVQRRRVARVGTAVEGDVELAQAVDVAVVDVDRGLHQIGRASCRERG